jgi:hypothetical protein
MLKLPQPLKFFIQKLYNFISYNRKVIVPAGAPGAVGGMNQSGGNSHLPNLSGGNSRQHAGHLYDCTPTFKLKYRIAYNFFT